MSRLIRRVAVVFLAIGIGGCSQSAPPPTLIQTDSGLVAGRVLDSGVKAWLGIPFARPPVRELRWKEAQPITWQGVYNADRKMSACIQVLRPHNINHYFGEEPTSEDCLYMNIWAPADASPASRLPVIVFVYGGGGTVGSSGMANYDGEQVAKRGAIYVNFNYRLGVLGFMAHPELTKEVFGAAAEEFLSLYSVTADAEIGATAQEAANDAAGLFNSRTCASLQAQYHESPAYITVFSRKHPYVPGVKIADQDPATIGAYHTAEVPYYFGTQDAYNLFRPTRNWTPWDRELSQKLTAALVAFATTGNPSTADVAWPTWSAQDERYISFGDQISVVTMNRARLEFMAKHRPAPAPPGGPRRFPSD